MASAIWEGLSDRRAAAICDSWFKSWRLLPAAKSTRIDSKSRNWESCITNHPGQADTREQGLEAPLAALSRLVTSMKVPPSRSFHRPGDRPYYTGRCLDCGTLARWCS